MISSSFSSLKTAFFTALALTAFAANSVLCRLALESGAIDPGSFTVVRMVSGIIVLLALLLAARGRQEDQRTPGRGSWRASLMLFLYAIAFSFAYVSLDTGTGALILFGAVQVSMLAATFLRGTALRSMEWVGLVLAFGGFVYLMLPGASAPSLAGFALMAVAGMAWAAYTLMGQGSNNPLNDTSFNFFRTAPLVILTLLLSHRTGHYSLEGVFYAALSGGLASGVGYALWYAALRNLSAIQAGVLQLLVPVIAAVGGVLFVGEALSLRLLGAGVLILGGIFAVLMGRQSAAHR